MLRDFKGIVKRSGNVSLDVIACSSWINQIVVKSCAEE